MLIGNIFLEVVNRVVFLCYVYNFLWFRCYIVQRKGICMRVCVETSFSGKAGVWVNHLLVRG